MHGSGNRAEAFAQFKSVTPIVKAELNFTRDSGKWQDRKWEIVPAQIAGDRATAPFPEGARVFFINLFDAQGLVVSAPHIELKE